MLLLNTFSIILSTVFIFLFGISKFSRQIHYHGGEKFKKILSTFTQTPFRGMIAGSIITAIIQSSTAATVMLVGLVDAGSISFYNSLGVIFGANIGTTITSQLVAFKILYLAPYIVIAGFLLDRLEGKYKQFGRMVFYLGMVLWCLLIINTLVEPLGSEPFALEIFSRIDNLFVAILVGFLATTILQSSSVTSGIVTLLVSQGLLNFNQGLGIILGSNIGTTSTALITSLVMGPMAKRTALAHFLFNFLGVVIFIPFVNVFSKFIDALDFGPEQKLALAHLGFNLVFAVLFLVFLKPFYNAVVSLSRRFMEAEE